MSYGEVSGRAGTCSVCGQGREADDLNVCECDAIACEECMVFGEDADLCRPCAYDLRLHSAEREVLEAWLTWVRINGDLRLDPSTDVPLAAVRRYRALLDGKAEGNEAT